MAFQGRRPGWKSHGAGRIPQGDQDVFAPRNFIHGPHESEALSATIFGVYADGN